MKYLLIITMLMLVGCGPQKVEFDKVEGGTTSTFGPNFEAWWFYCQGKIQFEDERDQTNYTEEEKYYYVRECYYDLDIKELPELPE